jgi:acyl-coenzyme A synthetase/AMP-(fatty) acid ligase
MNAVDYFFSESKKSEQLFILNENEQITHKALYEKVEKLAAFLNSEFGSGKNMLIYSGNSYFFVLAYLSTGICVSSLASCRCSKKV